MTAAVIVPSGCRHCGIAERTHFQRWTTAAGWHVWVAPTADQTKARMLARRTPAVLHPTQETR